MAKVAFLYPGQGAQTPGMGKDFYEQSRVAKEVYDTADKQLDFNLKSMCFDYDEQLHKTEFTQPCLVATELAITAHILDAGIKPDVTAGLSLGEYTAIAIAGGLSYEDAVRLVRKRGIYMEEAVPDHLGSMAAILGMKADQVEKVLAGREGVSIANYNCPGQIVITGFVEPVRNAMKDLTEAGARRTIELNVSGPFHSKYLVPAGEKLAQDLEHITFKKLTVPYVTNVTAKYVADSSQSKDLLIAQVSSSVRWQQSIEEMLKQGVTHFVEIGPGKTLSGFMRKIDRSAAMYHIGTMEEANRVIGELLCQIEK